MIRRILIISFVITLLCIGTALAEIKTVKADSTLNPADGSYGDPARIYAQADEAPEDVTPHSPLLDSQFCGPDGFPGPGPKHLERLRLKKLLELLELDETQRDRFIELFRGLRVGMMESHQKSRQVIDELAESLRSGDMPDDEIENLLARLEAIDTQRFEHMQKLHAEFKTILTSQQLAKFYIFRERFEPRILEHLGQRRGWGNFPGRGPGARDFPADSMDSLKR